jgi:hypothetical protein
MVSWFTASIGVAVAAGMGANKIFCEFFLIENCNLKNLYQHDADID